MNLWVINESTLTARTLEENFRLITEQFGLTDSPDPGLARMAQMVGGEAFEGTVSATEDSRFRHTLGRVPRMVCFQAPLDVVGDVRGLATGGVAGANATSWDAEFIYVRASAAGTYAFVVA